jgi:hypothetical protein
MSENVEVDIDSIIERLLEGNILKSVVEEGGGDRGGGFKFDSQQILVEWWMNFVLK